MITVVLLLSQGQSTNRTVRLRARVLAFSVTLNVQGSEKFEVLLKSKCFRFGAL